MAKKPEELREERKAIYVESLKRRQSLDLIEPLGRKIQSFLDGALAAEEVFKAAHHVVAQGDKLTKRFRNRPDVILAEIAMDENRYTTEIHEIGIKARLGDITAVFSDAIVNPADPRGIMAQGVAGAIKAAGGEEIEKEAVARAPIAIGKVIATTAGTLPNRHIIHVAVADEPDGPSSPEKVKRAVIAALTLAEELALESIALPGLGTGTGKISPEDSAAAILEAIRAHNPKSLSDITLIDRDEKIVRAFAGALERFDEENE